MPIERISRGFKDISMSFQANPLNDDLIGLKNENAIARSIKNIVFTLPGEKFFDEDFGSTVSQTLFENVDRITASNISDEIIQSIITYEPRVELLSVDVVPDFDANILDVTIVYKVVGADVPPQELSFALEPTR
tara:strand:+ start:2169 stop:2570 length:402 start_codon:yes stop_codon:yes gene_type:complete